MSEKRFWFVIDKGKLEYVQDNVTGENITVTELEDLLNEQQDIIEDLRAEDKRLNDVISNLHNELRQYGKKVKKQNMLINIQWDIIACLMELKGVIDDE